MSLFRFTSGGLYCVLHILAINTFYCHCFNFILALTLTYTNLESYTSV